MTDEKKLCDYCWVCLEQGKETRSTGIKYGYPVCMDHDNNDLDPEAMEDFVINLFK
jgi:hypothetical protein